MAQNTIYCNNVKKRSLHCYPFGSQDSLCGPASSVWSCVRIALRGSSGPRYSYEPTCSVSKSQAVVREPGQSQQPPYRMVLSATADRRQLAGILRHLPQSASVLIFLPHHLESEETVPSLPCQTMRYTTGMAWQNNPDRN